MEQLPTEDTSTSATGRAPTRRLRRAEVTALPESRSVEEQFSDFYRAAFSQLVAFLMYLEAREDEAVEAVQVAMHEALARWEEIEKPAAWCRTVAKRAFFKRKYSAEESFDDLPPESAPILTSALPDQQGVDDREHLVSLVRRLSRRQREVMVLWLLGLDRQEIAAETGATPQQVSANLTAAKAKLRELEEQNRIREQRR